VELRGSIRERGSLKRKEVIEIGYEKEENGEIKLK
jgi:hypothetical protein